jgi:hypothetical protein
LTRLSWQQETDAQISSASTSPERFAYSGDSELSQRIGVFSVAYDSRGIWRFGGGLAFSYTSLRMVQAVSDRVADPTVLRSLQVSSRLIGSAFQLQPIVGVQMDPSSKVRIGALLRTPGLPLYTSGTVTGEGTLTGDSATLGASLFDSSAKFEYKLPFELVGGLALIGSRAQVEIDVQGYSSISAYSIISSTQSYLIYTSPGNGAATTVRMQPFPGLTAASRAMTNVSIGGFLQLKRDKAVLLHWGVASDLSPVGSQDQIFDRIDFVTSTIGLSGVYKKLSYAAGVNYRGGSSNNILIRDTLSGSPIQTSIRISTLGMIYSLSYQF